MKNPFVFPVIKGATVIRKLKKINIHTVTSILLALGIFGTVFYIYQSLSVQNITNGQLKKLITQQQKSISVLEYKISSLSAQLYILQTMPAPAPIIKYQTQYVPTYVQTDNSNTQQQLQQLKNQQQDLQQQQNNIHSCLQFGIGCPP